MTIFMLHILFISLYNESNFYELFFMKFNKGFFWSFILFYEYDSMSPLEMYGI